jgi:hypothetical protein
LLLRIEKEGGLGRVAKHNFVHSIRHGGRVAGPERERGEDGPLPRKRPVTCVPWGICLDRSIIEVTGRCLKGATSANDPADPFRLADVLPSSEADGLTDLLQQ